MFDGKQLITVKWNNTNKDWYLSKGYHFTKRNDSFNVYAKDLHPGSRSKIVAECDYCGEKYQTEFVVLMNGRSHVSKDACQHCAPIKANEINHKRRAKKNFDKVREICFDNGYTLLTKEDDYTDVRMKIEFICPLHGKQSMSLDNFKHGHRCIKCSYDYRGQKMKTDISYVNNVISSINGNKLLNPESFTNTTDRNLNIQCACGNTYITSFANFIRHGVTRCHHCACSESVGEKRIREYLESKHIKYEQEKRFDDCRDIKPLPFDFYLSDYNLCIEFDGQQHYQNVFGEDELKRAIKHDKMKDAYCKKNRIKLLRIPYWDGNNIEEIIKERINA